MGWRTARLCAHESYMDCPYYEQLQYAGDPRIKALVSLYMTGDHRLMRNALEQLDSSRTSEGATYSRAPSAMQQYIPPACGGSAWSTTTAGMWTMRRSCVRCCRVYALFWAGTQVFSTDTGLLGAMPWWNYVDWVEK